MAKELQVTVRVEADLLERADALAAKLGRITTRTSLLREALHEGFAALEEKYKHVPASAPQTGRRKRS